MFTMKKAILLLTVFMLSGIMLHAQSGKNTVEVLYFKANLSCCKAKSCNALEADLIMIVEKSFPNGNVVFKEVKLVDEANKALVEKYKAESQTVIIVKKKKKKESFVNASDVVKKYLQTQDKAGLEKDLKAQIETMLKK
jgi:hypothetical protein